MTERALCVVAGFLALCFPLAAQQTKSPDVFSALNNSVLRLPSVTLSDGGLFSFSGAFNWMDATARDFLPALPTTAPQDTNTATAHRQESSKEVVDVRR